MNNGIKIVKLLLVVFISIFGYVFLFKTEALAYVCDSGTYCSAPLGGINGGEGVWMRYGSPQAYCVELTGIERYYPCSGTDANCNGGIYFYTSPTECLNDENLQYQGCCVGSGGGGDLSCGCGTQECLAEAGCSCTYTGCKRADGSNCISYYCPAPDPCVDCDYGNCPAPLTNTGLEEFKLANYRSCERTGSCAGTKYGDCYEPRDCVMGDSGCTEDPISSLEVLPSSIPNSRGCVSSTYTGLDMNNPIRMRSTHRDADGANDIEAIYIWLKTTTDIPNTPSFIDLDSNSGQTGRVYTNSSYGFLMHKEGNNWVPYIPSLLSDSTQNKWIKASYSSNRFMIKGPTGQNIAEVVVNSITPQGDTVVFDFSFDYRNILQANRPLDGSYNVFVMANDVFGFTPYDNYPAGITTSPKYVAEQIRYYNKWTDSSRDWSYDFTAPTVGNLSSQIEYPTYLRFNWDSNDQGGLSSVVVNAYISEGVNPEETDTISETTLTALGTKTISPQPFTLLNPPADINLIGNLNSQYLAKSVGINSTSDSQSIRVNTQSNRDGSLVVYSTAFDRACNYGSSYGLYDLEDWLITYGGLVYSENGIDFTVKNVEDSALWDPYVFLRKITPQHADLTSELFAGNASTSSTILNKLVRTNELRSYAVNPFRGYKPVNFYIDLKSTFERRESGISGVQRIPNTPTLVGSLSNYGTGGINVLDRNGNLTVGNNSIFNCNGRGIFFVSGNLTIQNGIANSNRNKDACIFVVAGNLIINNGLNTSSPTQMGYDEINGYFLVDGSVTINSDISYDGLYINGGIQSRNGILMNRYLGINYRNTYPALVIDHHSKYGLFSSILLGSPVDMAKTEVGFKPY